VRDSTRCSNSSAAAVADFGPRSVHCIYIPGPSHTKDALYPLACRRTAMHCTTTSPAAAVAAAVQLIAVIVPTSHTYHPLAFTHLHGLYGMLTWLQQDTLPPVACAHVCWLNAYMLVDACMYACLYVCAPALACCTIIALSDCIVIALSDCIFTACCCHCLLLLPCLGLWRCCWFVLCWIL
jgi:hypothetical protein